MVRPVARTRAPNGPKRTSTGTLPKPAGDGQGDCWLSVHQASPRSPPMHILRGRQGAAAVVAALALISTSAVAGPAQAHGKHHPKPKTVTVNLIVFNDFHGAIDPPTGSGGLVNGTPAGGVEYLATAIKKLRAQQEQESKYSFTVAAGDLVGASPLVSAA